MDLPSQFDLLDDEGEQRAIEAIACFYLGSPAAADDIQSALFLYDIYPDRVPTDREIDKALVRLWCNLSEASKALTLLERAAFATDVVPERRADQLLRAIYDQLLPELTSSPAELPFARQHGELQRRVLAAKRAATQVYRGTKHKAGNPAFFRFVRSLAEIWRTHLSKKPNTGRMSDGADPPFVRFVQAVWRLADKSVDEPIPTARKVAGALKKAVHIRSV